MFYRNHTSKKIGLEIVKNLYYFHEIEGQLDCNIYCIVDEESGEISLFDIGNGISLNGLFEGMKEFNLDYNNVANVIITHEHVDHVLGIYPLMELMKDKPPKIYAYGETAKILLSGDESKIFPGNFPIRPQDFGVQIIPHRVIDISDRKEIDFISDFIFQLHYTPGHSLGSVSYYEPSKKILIPGDVVFCGGSFGRFDFPGSSFKDLKNSIKALNDLDVKYLLPGHMGISDNGNNQINSSYVMIGSYGSLF